MATHNDTGKWGEAKAAAFLLNKGFEIVEKNYRYRHTEIDLIVKQDRLLLFVEVKTRTGTKFGMPETFVDAAKAKFILRAAEHYIFDHDWQFDVRFDIISVVAFPNGEVEIVHFEDAFYK